MEKDNDKKIHVALLFGGKSAEHEVSIRSAQSIYNVLDKSKYKITLIGIDKNGAWLSLNTQQFLSSKVIISDKQIPTYSVDNLFQTGKPKVDVVFPVLHGPFGEDGTIQGLLKLANVPFVGAGVLGSAVGMDKDVAKRLLRDAGLPNAKFHIYNEYERKTITFEKVRKDLGLPLFVKPANLGSSVGISKVHNNAEFVKAINSAFQYDSKLLIEEYIKGREIECSVLGNEKPIASVCGEIIPNHEFYSYEAKYLDDNGAALSIPAKISKPIMSKIRTLAIKAFMVLCCEGMARVDFFLKENGEIYINEINTIPGFTSISMYPKLWEESGIPYRKLINTLITLAIDKHNKEQKLKTSLK
jgi:D-alanine-D-alanine ligase